MKQANHRDTRKYLKMWAERDSSCIPRPTEKVRVSTEVKLGNDHLQSHYNRQSRVVIVVMGNPTTS